jgi:hypothetical protein
MAYANGCARLYDGSDKAAPCQTQLDASQCFAPLLRWLLAWWQGQELALAIDATAHGERMVVLVVSVLYRSSAIPDLAPAAAGGAPDDAGGGPGRSGLVESALVEAHSRLTLASGGARA